MKTLKNKLEFQEESWHTCHSSSLTGVEMSRDGELMLTSSAYVKPYSALWRVGELVEDMYKFDDDHFVEFSKWHQDRIVGTHGEEARV